jgi:hypothetical protein
MKQKTKKEYCVHIYEPCHEIEDIWTTSPQKAELMAMDRFNGGDYQDIANVEVMVVCQNCHTDNDLDEKVCGSCGEKL